ncbi:MAG: ABC transporter ATP-binding protein [Candidatus Limnocylindrales bacterium]
MTEAPIPGAPEPVLRLAGVGVRRSGRWILADIDWAIRPGERWVVVGPNGAGKTTLASIAATYLWPSTGTVEVLGERIGAVDARELRRRIGYVSASLSGLVDDHLTALDLVMSARDAALAPWWAAFGEDDRDTARACLERMGVGAFAGRTVGTLSSGERQRVLIARTLMMAPALLILDEPAAGLDLGAREGHVDSLTVLAAGPSPAAIVLVTHHLEEIPPGFDRALVLADGRAVAAGPIERTLTGATLSDAYGMALRVEVTDGRYTARRSRPS